ncbi:MAG: hypothetical protein ACXWNR_05790 [Candidatus Limnocylindrales bacterium]
MSVAPTTPGLPLHDCGALMLDRTDSYCERCGTRYAFGANAPRTLSLKGARVLAKGLKNFVLTDGQSMNDAMALARQEDEHEDTTRMTEAFHRTFNFCMTCRQYACDKCWNAHQGACLTCAPERESGPVAPEDHLIIRTPVARSNSDRSLFPEILGGKSEDAADVPPAPSAWPAQDLEAMASDPGDGGKARKAHEQPVRTQEDLDAWSVWPIADEIAPEMTLTPGEMVLVEAQLANDEAIEAAAVAQEAQLANDEAIEAAAVAQETVSPEASPVVPETDVWAMPGDLAAISASTGEPSSPVADSEIAPQTPAAPPEQRPVVARLLGRFSQSRVPASPPPARVDTSPRSEPSGDPWPHVTAWSDRPISVHEWPADASPVTPAPVAEPVAEVAAEPVAEVAAEPMPEIAQIAATYTEVPVEQQPVELEAPIEAETAAPGAGPAISPEVLADEPPVADLTAVWEPASSPPFAPLPAQEPVTIAANQQTLFDATPATNDVVAERGPEPVAWPEVFGDVSAAPRQPAAPNATPAAPPLAVSTPPSRGPQTPAPWPPLGASWPAKEAPGAPWPGPEAPTVPAVVAAREAAIPVLAEMWAQSAQQVLNRGSVRVCHHCALPVSTHARFCRRCGTKQA